MSDLISRSALIEAMEKKYELAEKKAFYSVGLSEGFIIAEEIIKEQPTVETKPVVHGEWKFEMSTVFPVYRCSECNCATALGQTKFCPNCGADMRGEKID